MNAARKLLLPTDRGDEKMEATLTQRPMPSKVVAQPTMSIHVAGHMRMQIPASKDMQAVFDIAPPAVKENPALMFSIAAEAEEAGKVAASLLSQALDRSPQLRAMANEVNPNYADVDGKLFYIFLLPVRSA